jgi:hypothetical protein
LNDPPTFVCTWKAVHTTGWESWIAEGWSGDFVIWVCPVGENAQVECVEDTLDHALLAASSAMLDRTGHRCTDECAWRVVEHRHR